MIIDIEEKLDDDEYQALESHAKKGSNKRKVCDHSPKSFKGNQDPKETTHLLIASHATRWDTLQEIVHSKQNNSRRSSMLMQLKKMNQLKK